MIYPPFQSFACPLRGHGLLGRSEDRLALLLTTDQEEREQETHGSDSGYDREANNKAFVLVGIAFVALVLPKVLFALKEVTLAAEVIVGAGGVPSITEGFLDRHLFELPFVVVRIVELGFIELAEKSRRRFALVQASFHHEETLAGIAHGSTTVPAVARPIGFVQATGTGDSGTVTASVVLPRVALSHVIALRTGRVLVEVLEVALVRDRAFPKQGVGDGIIGIFILVEEPHGVALALIIDDLKGVGPHAFAQISTVGVDIFELGARIFPAKGGGSDGRHQRDKDTTVAGRWKPNSHGDAFQRAKAIFL